MKTLYLNNNEFSVFCKVKRRKQNHKISFHFLSGSPHTPRRKWIGKEIFGFGLRPKGARGASIILQNPADFARTIFELCPKNTAS